MERLTLNYVGKQKTTPVVLRPRPPEALDELKGERRRRPHRRRVSGKAGMVKSPPVQRLRHAQFERRPAQIPVREAIGVHVEEAIVG